MDLQKRHEDFVRAKARVLEFVKARPQGVTTKAGIAGLGISRGTWTHAINDLLAESEIDAIGLPTSNSRRYIHVDHIKHEHTPEPDQAVEAERVHLTLRARVLEIAEAFDQFTVDEVMSLSGARRDSVEKGLRQMVKTGMLARTDGMYHKPKPAPEPTPIAELPLEPPAPTDVTRDALWVLVDQLLGNLKIPAMDDIPVPENQRLHLRLSYALAMTSRK